MTTKHTNFARYDTNPYEPAHYRMTRCGTQRLLAAIAKEHPNKITKGEK